MVITTVGFVAGIDDLDDRLDLDVTGAWAAGAAGAADLATLAPGERDWSTDPDVLIDLDD
jgi:hypothetical protein